MSNMRFERLGNIISISKGKKHNIVKTISTQARRYIQINDLRNDLNIQYTDDEKGTYVNKEDLIIAWDGANAGTVGYNLDGLIGSTLARLKVKDLDKYNSKYLALFLQSKFSYLKSKTTGATIPHLHRETLENLKIPILEIEEQIKIANLLSKIENILQEREKSIKLLDSLVKSTFLDIYKKELNLKKYIFDDLKEDKKHTFSNGPFGSNLLSREFTNSGVPVVYIRDLKDGSFNWISNVYVTKEKADTLESCKIVSNDLLLSKVGEPPGISTVYPENLESAIMTQDVIRIRLDKTKALPKYMQYYLNSQVGQFLIKKIIVQGTRKRFSLKNLKSLVLEINSLEEQKKFEKKVIKIENTKKTYENSLDKLKQLFNSTSQRAFKGELDLSLVTLKFEDKFPNILDEKIHLEEGSNNITREKELEQKVDKKKKTDKLKKKEKSLLNKLLNKGLIVGGTALTAYTAKKIFDNYNKDVENDIVKNGKDITSFVNNIIEYEKDVKLQFNDRFLKSFIKVFQEKEVVLNNRLLEELYKVEFEKKLTFPDIKDTLLNLLERKEVEQFEYKDETLNEFEENIAFRIKE